MNKLVITAAVTGSITTPEQSKYLPMTPEDVAEEARRTYEEGPPLYTFMPAIQIVRSATSKYWVRLSS